jgi:hypothetical protein
MTRHRFNMAKVNEATLLRRENDSESLSADDDVSDRKPTFRQRRSLHEATTTEEVAVFEEEEIDGDDDEESVETDPIPGAFRAGPSSLVENEESTSDTEEDRDDDVIYETHVMTSSPIHVQSAPSETDSPLEAKVVDDSVVEAEVQARVQEELRQRPLVEAVASRDVKFGRAVTICSYVVVGLVLVVALTLGLLAGLRVRVVGNSPDPVNWEQEYNTATAIPSDFPSLAPSQSLSPSLTQVPSEAPSIPGPPSVSSQPSSSPSYPLQIQVVQVEVDLYPLPSGQPLIGWDKFVFESVTEQFIHEHIFNATFSDVQNLAISADILTQISPSDAVTRRILSRNLQDGSLHIVCDVVLRFRSSDMFLNMQEAIYLIFNPYETDPFIRSNDYMMGLQENSTTFSSLQSVLVYIPGYQSMEGDIATTTGSGFSGAKERTCRSLVTLTILVCAFLCGNKLLPELP